MGSTFRLRLLIIVAFTASVGFMYYSYKQMQTNIDKLVVSVDKAARPDKQLISLKELWTSFRNVGNNVRAFSVTRDDRFLTSYLDLKDHFIETIDSLENVNKMIGQNTSDFDTLKNLFIKKSEVYENLLEINYNNVVREAVSKMDKSEPAIDTTLMQSDGGNVFQRMFSSKYSKRSLKARADSILDSRNKIQIEYKKNLKLIRAEEERLLKEQEEKELTLLKLDDVISSKLESVIVQLESQERLLIADRIKISQQQAKDSANQIKQTILIGGGVLLLLLLLVLIDIEVASRRKKELLAARKKAELLAGAREEFIATMSHEIRTPLTSVIGFGNKLSGTELDADQKKFINAINGSSKHLLAIVNDVLDFTRIESGKLKLEEISFNPSEIFTEVVEALKWRADEKNIRLNLFARPVLKSTLYGDPTRLRQVVYNLVGNAIKFTEKGSIDVNVTMVESNEHPVLLFKVADTGIGIAPEKLGDIFKEYEQATASTERKYGGTGLGLAISKKIIDQCGGSITVESNLGLGSVFTVKIPYKWGESTFQENSFSEDFKEKIFKNYSILIAEDDPLIRELQSKSLEDAGAKIFAVSNGKEAIEVFRANHIDVLLIDVQMPVLSGPETAKIIREQLSFDKKNVPIIAMTANVLQHDLKQYLDAGMSDFITKPFRESELFEKLLKVLKLKVSATHQNQTSVAKTVIPSLKTEKLYDLSELILTSSGNTEFVKKMINLFLTSSFASINNLKFHLKQNNTEQLGKTAHRMIGSYNQIGAEGCALYLKELERECLENANPEKIEMLVKEIETSSGRIFELMKIELKKY